MLHKSSPIIFAALIVASCHRQDDNICEKPPSSSQFGEAECIHRSAYQLRFAPGTNTELAKAVVEQCSSEVVARSIERLSKMASASAEEEEQSYEIELQGAQSDALRRIVQAKAGNCDKPA